MSVSAGVTATLAYIEFVTRLRCSERGGSVRRSIEKRSDVTVWCSRFPDEELEAYIVLGSPASGIVLSVQKAGPHERIVIRLDGIETVVDREVRQTNAVVNDSLMKLQGYVRARGKMADGLAIDVETSHEAIQTVDVVRLVILLAFDLGEIGMVTCQLR